MSKNLFQQSLTHLLPVEAPLLSEEVVPNPEPFVLSRNKTKVGIFLGKGVVVESSREAYQKLLDNPYGAVPVSYRNEVTQSFLNATESGRINSLFKDWKKYREGVRPKIAAYFQHIKEFPETHKVATRYVSYLLKSWDPMREETYKESGVDQDYFKFWCVFKFFAETK